MERGNGFPFVTHGGLDLAEGAAAGAAVDHGIEEDEGVGAGAGGGVLAGLIEAAERGDGGGEKSTGGSASDGDALGIETEVGGVLADPTHGGERVHDRLVLRRLVARADAILDGDRDHPA